MQILDSIILVALSGITMSINNTNAKAAIKQAVIDAVTDNKDNIISQIVAQKRTMFDENSHTWSPLLPQTIARKKREKDLFRSPESINIRKGELFKAFTSANNYQTIKSNTQIVFDIELNSFEQTKVGTVATHGRDVIDLTQNELNQITNDLAAVISDTLRQKYE